MAKKESTWPLRYLTMQTYRRSRMIGGTCHVANSYVPVFYKCLKPSFFKILRQLCEGGVNLTEERGGFIISDLNP